MFIHGREGKTVNIGDIEENFWSVSLYSKRGWALVISAE